MKITHKGKSYLLRETGWCDTQTYLTPTAALSAELNHVAQPLLIEEDKKLTDRSEILKAADSAFRVGHFKRAWLLLFRLWEESGKTDLNVLSKMTSLLREGGKPLKALEISEPFRNRGHQALLTSRAAAHCDLRQFDEAKSEVGKALRLSESEEAFLVVKRIKAARPDLYQKN